MSVGITAVNEITALDLPWWGWALLVIGLVSLIAVLAALFLPDWFQPQRLTATFDEPAGSEAFLRATAAALNVPILRGGRAEMLQNGDAFFPAMLEAIRGARENVNFQVYIFEPEGVGAEFLEAFKERARAGVQVRLQVDAIGSHKLDKHNRAELRAAGCRVSRFRPLRFLTLVRVFKRDHRRAIVVDGRVGFLGGGAIAEKWTGNAQDPHHWRDSMVRVTGPMVTGVQTAFGENWVYCTGEVIAGGQFYPFLERSVDGKEEGHGAATISLASSPSDSAQPIRLLYWLSFRAARKRIWISSSYFIPGREIRQAIMSRARAGVDVRILVPGKRTDAKPVRLAGRSFYEELMEAGVRIFEYEPTMMHAKTVVVDGVWSVVGSSNMDERSTEINEENNMGIADPDFAEEIERGFLADLERATEMKLEEWRTRSPVERVMERIASLLIEQY